MLDTDSLVAAAYADASTSRRILEACLRRDVQAVISLDIRCEYEYIVSRAVQDRDFSDLFRRFLENAEVVEPVETPRVVPEDPDDDKSYRTKPLASCRMKITQAASCTQPK